MHNQCKHAPGTDYFIQAIGDGGQGWGNALLFVAFSKNIRDRLFVNPVKKLCGCIPKKSAQARPTAQSYLLETAPSSNPVSCPSSTFFIVPHSNHSDFTTSVRDTTGGLDHPLDPKQSYSCCC